MTLLPVVERELRVASRRSWTYWGRAGAALLAIAVSAWFLLLQGSLHLGQMGKPLFGTLSFLAFIFAALAGVTHSADCVSSEKREGTLGLLFLTDLRGADVTLGKLAASSLGAIYSLLASLPVLALALLLGGVTAAEYWRMVLVLVDLLLLSLATGVLMSVCSTDGKRAAVATFLNMVAALFLLPALGGLAGLGLRRLGYPDPLIESWLMRSAFWMSPAAGYARAFDGEYRTHAGQFWLSQGFTLSLAVLFLSLASWRLPRSWQETGAEPKQRGWRGRLERWRFPTAMAKARFRTRLLELGPVTWLAGRHWLRPLLVWAFLLAAAGVFLLFAWQIGDDWWNGGVYLTTSILLHTVLKVWLASEAPRQFLDDRRSGALELLLSTPLSVGELLRGRFVALRRQFAGPVVAVLLLDAVFLMASAAHDVSSGDDQFYWALLWVLRMAFLAFDAVALAWTGLWTGMTAQGNRSTSPVLLRILVLPWLACLAGLTAIAISALAARGDWFTPALMLAGWSVIGAGNNALWILRARRRLTAGFRGLATQRPGQKRGWFRRGEGAGVA